MYTGIMQSLTDVIVTTRQKMALYAEAAANMAEMANEPLKSYIFFSKNHNV